ncbi:MAG: hypothetical protein ACSHW7_01470 [Patiriisocius sp.]|uniref:hypothetical protein n=1 Tax=Patiriisocius sp. TaxID=2822396 RepID=UPI003EF9B89A
MKKLLSLLAIALAIASCGNDDDAIVEQEVELGIVGEFEMTNYNSPLNDDYNGDGVTSSNLIVEAPCFELTLILNSDNTYNLNGNDLQFISNSNGELSVDCLNPPFVELGTYTMTDNVLSLNQESTTNDDPFEVIPFSTGQTTVSDEGLVSTLPTAFGELVVTFERR